MAEENKVEGAGATSGSVKSSDSNRLDPDLGTEDSLTQDVESNELDENGRKLQLSEKVKYRNRRRRIYESVSIING